MAIPLCDREAPQAWGVRGALAGFLIDGLIVNKPLILDKFKTVSPSRDSDLVNIWAVVRQRQVKRLVGAHRLLDNVGTRHQRISMRDMQMDVVRAESALHHAYGSRRGCEIVPAIRIDINHVIHLNENILLASCGRIIRVGQGYELPRRYIRIAWEVGILPDRRNTIPAVVMNRCAEDHRAP